MAESLSVPLGEQEHLKEFFEVMRDNGKKMQAEDMERLFEKRCRQKIWNAYLTI